MLFLQFNMTIGSAELVFFTRQVLYMSIHNIKYPIVVYSLKHLRVIYSEYK